MTKPTKALAILKDESSLAQFQASMQKVLPSHITPVRMTQVALRMMRKNPALGNCTPQSFANAMLACSEIGLEPDGRFAHLVPFGQECTLIVDYKGLVDIARRSGEITTVKAFVVRENDLFVWSSDGVRHEINPTKPRGEFVAVYSMLVYTNGFKEYGEPMSKAEVEAVRKRSRASGSGPWQTDWEEMAKKTVIRRDSKTWPMSPQFKLALDNDGDQIEIKDITSTVTVSSKLDDVLDAGEPEKPKEDPKPKAKAPAKKDPPPADKKQEAKPDPAPPEEEEDDIKPFDQMSKDELCDYLHNMYHGRINEDQQAQFQMMGNGHLDNDNWFEEMGGYSVTKLQALCNDIAAEFE